MKKKINYTLNLYVDEERILNESLKHGINSISWLVLKKAYKRGDFKKEDIKERTWI